MMPKLCSVFLDVQHDRERYYYVFKNKVDTDHNDRDPDRRIGSIHMSGNTWSHDCIRSSSGRRMWMDNNNNGLFW